MIPILYNYLPTPVLGSSTPLQEADKTDGDRHLHVYDFLRSTLSPRMGQDRILHLLASPDQEIQPNHGLPGSKQVLPFLDPAKCLVR
jgi:hypothetical protein